jgi:dipicolinate synthase subunit A
MKQPVFYTAGATDALLQARNHLTDWGHTVSPTPCNDVSHLLLPVPSFDQPGMIKGGIPLQSVVEKLPEDLVILGGNLSNLSQRHVDFLKDPYYLNENAAITAHCAVKLLQEQCISMDGIRVLVIGWGRIGKHLLPLLKAKGADVCAAVRKESDLAALHQLGNNGISLKEWNPRQFQIIINTAPAHVLDENQADPSAVLMDLASVKGIEGDRVIWARGLPNKKAPDRSGLLIAKTALRYALGREHL